MKRWFAASLFLGFIVDAQGQDSLTVKQIDKLSKSSNLRKGYGIVGQQDSSERTNYIFNKQTRLLQAIEHYNRLNDQDNTRYLTYYFFMDTSLVKVQEIKQSKWEHKVDKYYFRHREVLSVVLGFAPNKALLNDYVTSPYGYLIKADSLKARAPLYQVKE